MRQAFDVTKYKDVIVGAAKVSGVLDVSVAHGSLKGDYEPTFYLSCWATKDRTMIEDKFVDYVCGMIEEDVDWLVLAEPPAVVRENLGVLLIRDGAWCYDRDT